ncbi:MAG TPA: hypothetical protein VKG44_10185 [Candidatus Baltobacteraceae bacterium]|nr:hypothetical protein [Candidatus Baltobacteraceae bacterium]
MFLSLDGTSIVQLINFGIFYLILNAVFLRPVGRAIRARREHIDEVKSGYERDRRQIANLHEEADAKRAAARREAQERVAAARAQTEKDTAAENARNAERAAAIADEARATAETERAQARKREPELAAELARTLLGRVLGEAAK